MFDQLEFKPKSDQQKKKRRHDGLSLTFATMMTLIGVIGIYSALSAIQDAEAHRELTFYSGKATAASGFMLMFGLQLFFRGYRGMDFTLNSDDKPKKSTIVLSILTMLASVAFAIWVDRRLSALGYG